jgi:hypothetical protein
LERVLNFDRRLFPSGCKLYNPELRRARLSTFGRNRMGERSEPGSWWRTAPGVLTAIAALLTAITGLIAGLHKAGLLQGAPHRPVAEQTVSPRGAAGSPPAAGRVGRLGEGRLRR